MPLGVIAFCEPPVLAQQGAAREIARQPAAEGLAVVSGRVNRSGLAGRGQAPAFHGADARIDVAGTRRSGSSRTSARKGRARYGWGASPLAARLFYMYGIGGTT